MREKILKDKETRRRKAAEVIKSKDEVCLVHLIQSKNSKVLKSSILISINIYF